MWGKIIIPMYRLWLNGLYGLYGPRCPLFSKRLINLISLSPYYFHVFSTFSPHFFNSAFSPHLLCGDPQKIAEKMRNSAKDAEIWGTGWLPLDVLGTALPTFSWNLRVKKAVKQTSSTLLICKYFNTILCMLLLKLLLPLFVSAWF